MPYGMSEEEYKKPHIASEEELREVLDAKDLTFAQRKGVSGNVSITYEDKCGPDGGFEKLSVDEALEAMKGFSKGEGVVVNTNGYLRIVTRARAEEIIEKAAS